MTIAQTLRIVNEQGIPFRVRLIGPGQAYGRNDCLCNENADTLVEFYDARHPHTMYGQFVSRYFAATLLNSKNTNGLCLDGGVRDWNISADNMAAVLTFLNEELVPA